MHLIAKYMPLHPNQCHMGKVKVMNPSCCGDLSHVGLMYKCDGFAFPFQHLNARICLVYGYQGACVTALGRHVSVMLDNAINAHNVVLFRAWLLRLLLSAPIVPYTLNEEWSFLKPFCTCRDLSYWGFQQLAHPLNGIMMTEFRPVNCDTHEPLQFNPGFINSTIYGDRVETGWAWFPYKQNTDNFWLPVCSLLTP